MPVRPTDDFIDHLHEEFLERLRTALREWQAARRSINDGTARPMLPWQMLKQRMDDGEDVFSALADEWLQAGDPEIPGA